MFNLINFCKFFANSKEIPENSRVSLGTVRRPAADKIVFTILGQKIEMLLENGTWQPLLLDLFEQQQQEQQEQQQEQQEQEQEQEQQQEQEQEQEQEQQQEQEQEQEQQQEQQEQEFIHNICCSKSVLLRYAERGKFGSLTTAVELKATDFGTKLQRIGMEISQHRSRFFDVWFLDANKIARYFLVFEKLNDCKILVRGKKGTIVDIIGTIEITKDQGFSFTPKTEQEEPMPAPELEQEEPMPAPKTEQEEPMPAPELEQEEPMPAPKTEQEEPTSPIYRYFETTEGSSIGVYKIGEETIIGIADKAGNLWNCRNLGKQGKKRVIYAIFGDDQQLSLKPLGSIHGAIIEARNFLQAAKKAKKSAKIEIKAAFLGHEAVKIAKIELINGSYNLTVFTSAGEEVVPKMPQKEEETTNKAELSPIEPVFNAKTASISEQLTKLRELQEQTTVILKNLQAKGMSLEQIKALLATN